MKARYVIEKNHYSDLFLSFLGHFIRECKEELQAFVFVSSLSRL